LNIGCGGSSSGETMSTTLIDTTKAIQQHRFQCLQNHPNPNYRICCAWDKSVECETKRSIKRSRSTTLD
jgi:hypothetical protein